MKHQVNTRSYNENFFQLILDTKQSKSVADIIKTHQAYLKGLQWLLIDLLDKNSQKDLACIGAIEVLNQELTAKIFGRSFEKYKENDAIGALVEALISRKAPRLPSIEAVADWLKISPVKVRTANERYRKKPKISSDHPNQKLIQEHLSREDLSKIENLIKKSKILFTPEHSKVKLAAKKLSQDIQFQQ